ncbi:DUF3306 domain-containing protein [Ramlibacter rhizophilus]|uniref:DUF3306 domain-containing protein n=1 Tax=Ramlibacter rhizophilus TaxID=1781167 RepID=A0A4Z0BTF1_9BURK|nr:DUF3306 domain-containing protein [Ramlibacter rhizophilus]TFZ01518.1 DUF3306 domain-containing protein [Ramlibacter rhizophilus]
MADGFLGRWARRKLDVQQGKPVEPDPEPPVAALSPRPSELPVPPAAAPEAKPAEPTDERPPAPPPPTLEDVAALTPDDDFSRFVASDVAPDVKNAAVKKLFADPHFNLMDGLDVYIDDYSKPDPLPESMLRDLASAEFLGLFREEKDTHPDVAAPAGGTREAADAQVGQTVAQSQPPEETPSQGVNAEDGRPASERPSHHADPDLRLQQDHAPGPEGPGPGPR